MRHSGTETIISAEGFGGHMKTSPSEGWGGLIAREYNTFASVNQDPGD